MSHSLTAFTQSSPKSGATLHNLPGNPIQRRCAHTRPGEAGACTQKPGAGGCCDAGPTWTGYRLPPPRGLGGCGGLCRDKWAKFASSTWNVTHPPLPRGRAAWGNMERASEHSDDSRIPAIIARRADCQFPYPCVIILPPGTPPPPVLFIEP